MASRRKAGRARTVARSAAQQRAYRAGIAHGKALAAAALTRQRKAAARKAAATRALRPKAERRKVAEVAVGVDELLLYEAPPEEGAPILSGLDFAEWVEPTEWGVHVELWVEGEMVQGGQLAIAAEWDQEPAAKRIRREVRSWYDEQMTNHPEWAESPAATIIRLSLRRLR
jgi:hypothetical protein